MSAGGINAGKAFVEIYLNDRRFIAGLNRVQADLGKFSASVAKVGGAALAAGVGMLAPIASAGSVFLPFEKSMAQVKAMSGATGKEFDALRGKAMDLGKTTAFTASQVADGMKYMAMAGYDTNQILSGIPEVLNLALAGGMDLGRASDIATDIATPFGIAAENISVVTDVLAKAATSSNTSVEQMGEGFKYAAAGAATAGQSIQEMATGMAILANSGIKASMAGTSLRQVMIAFSNASSAKKLKELGVNVSDADGNMRQMLDVLRDLDAATAGMGNVEKMGTYFQIFGARAGNAAMVLGGAGQVVDEFRDKMWNATGTTAEMARVMADTLQGDVVGFQSSIEGLKISIMDALNVPLREATQQITLFVRSTSDWISQNPHVVTAFATAGIAIAGTGIVLLGVAGAAKLAAIGMGVLGTVYTTVKSVVTLATLAYAAATGIATIAVSAFAAAVQFLLGSLLLVGGAVLLFYFGLVPLWNYLKKIASGIHTDIAPALELLKDAFALGDIETSMKIAWETIKYSFEIGLEHLYMKLKMWKAAALRLFADFVVAASPVLKMKGYSNELINEIHKGLNMQANLDEKLAQSNLKMQLEGRREEYKKTMEELKKLVEVKKEKAAADEEERKKNEENMKAMQKRAYEQMKQMQQLQGELALMGVDQNAEMMKSVRGTMSNIAMSFTGGGVFNIWDSIRDSLKKTEKNTGDTVEAIQNLDLEFALLE